MVKKKQWKMLKNVLKTLVKGTKVEVSNCCSMICYAWCYKLCCVSRFITVFKETMVIKREYWLGLEEHVRYHPPHKPENHSHNHDFRLGCFGGGFWIVIIELDMALWFNG